MKQAFHIDLRRFGATGFRGVLAAVSSIPFVVAPLTKRPATLRICMAFIVIHVGDREDNFASRLGM